MNRLERVRSALEAAELDAIFVGGAVDDVFGVHSANRRWLSGFTGSSGWAVATQDHAVFAADFRYTEQAEQECGGRGFNVWKTEGGMKEWFARLCGELGLAGKRVAFTGNDTTAATMEALHQIVSEMPERDRPELRVANDVLEPLRATKDAEELMLLSTAIECADLAFEDVARQLEAGQIEMDVALAVQAAVRRHGAEDVSFATIVAGGAWGARPHAHPRPEAIRAGEPVIIDMGARVGGYCSDLTRTISAGTFPGDFHAIYEIVLQAQASAIEGVEAGMSGKAAHELADRVIREAGYGEYFGHGLGHGVGLDVHEKPYLGRTSADTLQDGMVFTIEPGIYLPGKGGVRIEDVVVLEDGKARVLSRAPKLEFAEMKGARA